MAMILKESLPESVERAFRKVSKDAEIQLAMAGDIGDDGRFGEKWLLATADDVIVFSPDGNEALLHEKLPLKDLNGVKTQSLIGSSALEATTSSGNLVELLRYSNVHSAKFAVAAKWLDQVAKGEEPSPITEEGPARCPKCGMLLAKESKICPRCVQRGKVIIRLVTYLKPHRLIVCAIIILTLSGTGIRLIPPYLTKILVDDVLSSSKYDLLGWLVLALLGMRLIGVVLDIFMGRTTAWLGSRISYDIRGQFYEMVQRIGILKSEI